MTFFFAISLAISRFTSLLYYAKLDGKVVCDNNKFCKTVKPNTCITLLENKVVESIERKVAEILQWPRGRDVTGYFLYCITSFSFVPRLVLCQSCN